MTDVSVEIRNLKKYYPISRRKSYSFTDLSEIFTSAPKQDSIKKVLDGIDLDIYRGECFGIIGSNGTGKSTLLRLISGIIPPDSGSIKTNGTLIPLLSLGVGFTDDLTAHDNVYQYGMILGFREKEMDALYDDIIAFAGLEQYQYMLLRNFSSGMRVKLAFATAAQIKPDILVLDEVLSVGDISFKEKSRQKILDFCKSDKTVVIVSHSMSTISSLCDRAMFLKDGKIQSLGSPAEVIDQYVASVSEKPLEYGEIAFTHSIRQYQAGRREQDYARRVISRASELDLFPLVRARYSKETEQSLNEYLTWENLRRISHLESVIRASEAEFSGDETIAGYPAISFLKKLGSETESREFALEMIRKHCRDGFICGSKKLTALFSGSGTADIPGKVLCILIRSDSRTIPILVDADETTKTGYRLVETIYKKSGFDSESTVVILSPGMVSPEGLAELDASAIRFVAPIQRQDIENNRFSPEIPGDITSAENLLMHNERPVFAKRIWFSVGGKRIDGFGFFDPRSIAPDYNTHFTRLAVLRSLFDSSVRPPSMPPEAFISQIAKKDAMYFTQSGDESGTGIGFNADSIARMQKLMGTTYICQSAAGDAGTCYRNYEYARLTGLVFNQYLGILLSSDPLHRGKILSSLINNLVRLGSL